MIHHPGIAKAKFELAYLKFVILTSSSPFSSSKEDKKRRLFKAFSIKSNYFDKS